MTTMSGAVCAPYFPVRFTQFPSSSFSWVHSAFPQFSVSFIQQHPDSRLLSSVSPLTSLSWLAMLSRVTGLLGLLPSLTGGMCPFLMIGTVPSGWPEACGCRTACPCPADEASLEPRVRYCLTCWFWVWWRWNLEFSRWFCTCTRKNKRV